MNSPIEPIAIVGSSIAGTALAIRLAKSGFRSVLIDKAHFPRHKPCGEGLSPAGLIELSEIVSPQIFVGGYSRHFDGYRISRDTQTVASHMIEGSRDHLGMGVQRFYFDKALLDFALNTKMVDFENASVKSISQHDSNIEILFDRSSGTTGKKSMRFPVVVVAAGSCGQALCVQPNFEIDKSARATNTAYSKNLFKLPKQLLTSIQRSSHRTRMRYGVRLELESIAPHNLSHISLFLKEKSQIFFTPVGERNINLSILSDRRGLCGAFSGTRAVDSVKKICELISCDAQIVAPALGAGPFSRFPRKNNIGKVMLIGDSRHQYDPISGMGMTHALVSARFAHQSLEMLLNQSNDPFNVDKAIAHYSENMQRWSKYLPGFCFTALATLGNTSLKDFSDFLTSSTIASETFKLIHWGMKSRSVSNMLARTLLLTTGAIR